MNKVIIMSDSTCDLSPEIIEANDIKIIPLYVNFEDESYLDYVEMDAIKLFDKVVETGIHPKSSAVSPATFTVEFKKYIDEGYDILYTGLGSGFSATYQSAYTASLEFPENRIFLVDSENLSSGTGLLIMKAIKFRAEGNSAAEIKEKLDKIVPNVRSQFVIDTLDYLHMGGRCSGTARIFGSLLKLHPLIKVVDNAMIVAKKPRGRLHKGIDVMLDDFFKDLDRLDQDCIFITHADGFNLVSYIENKIKDVVDLDKVIETKAGSVIGTHCGPKTIGILYIVKD